MCDSTLGQEDLEELDNLRWILKGNIEKYNHEYKFWCYLSDKSKNICHTCEIVQLVEYYRIVNNMIVNLFILLKECNRMLKKKH
jgi:hypothetical protein